ncbi:hypothetical protein T440DRAFT_49031 [Plenodomus tracheiphilus IPT5]|uniref:Uncharacterized protein n=1 Tax=Plenodomus tracheiphilus IPT5 TaxID=1408161 RepID=A0A6A7B9V3_9PLEO|nr:hypothetical protein T440DRAFT_49031 [Plenodomus tracheiphilus IPT5]
MCTASCQTQVSGRLNKNREMAEQGWQTCSASLGKAGMAVFWTISLVHRMMVVPKEGVPPDMVYWRMGRICLAPDSPNASLRPRQPGRNVLPSMIGSQSETVLSARSGCACVLWCRSRWMRWRNVEIQEVLRDLTTYKVPKSVLATPFQFLLCCMYSLGPESRLDSPCSWPQKAANGELQIQCLVEHGVEGSQVLLAAEFLNSAHL